MDDPEAVASATAKWGLDKSLPEQYFIYLGNLTKGDLASASGALEQAISIAPDMGNLYYERTNLLINLGRSEDAFCCIETGISLARTDSSLPRLYLLAAWLYRLNGDLASALGYIQKGHEVNKQLSIANPGSQAGLPLSDRILAADIFRAALQPHKAYQLLKTIPEGSDDNGSSAYFHYQWAGLKTELELVLGYTPDLKSFDQSPSETIPLSAGWLAVQARLGLRAGNTELADKVYHSSNNVVNDFIKYAEYLYGSDVTRESTVTSVFDLLYSEHTNTLLTKYKQSPNKHKTELLMCDLINQVLKHHSYIGYSMHTRLGKLVKVPNTFSDAERRYILHPWTHVDFLFYNKVSKEKLFVIEVDGIRYHEQDKKQAEHDDIKNRVLQSNNIPIFRFKTNESSEKRRLTEIIKDFSH